MCTPRLLAVLVCLPLVAVFGACDDDVPRGAPGPVDGGASEGPREASVHDEAPLPADRDAWDASADGAASDAPPTMQAPGTLAVIAGEVGLGRARDGVGTFARWGEILDLTFDPGRRRFYLIDRERSDQLLRRYDPVTNTVTTIARGLRGEQIVFQGGSLFVLGYDDVSDPALFKLAPEDGRELQRYPLLGLRSHCIAAAPDGNRIYLGRGGDASDMPPSIDELDPATGARTTLKLSGHRLEEEIAGCVMAPSGRLLIWMRYAMSYEDPTASVVEHQLLDIDLGARQVALVRRFSRAEQPELNTFLHLDPGGDYAGADSHFYRFGPTGPALRLPPQDLHYGMVRDGQDLYVGRGLVLERRPGGTGEPLTLVGLPDAPRGFNQPGPGQRTRLRALRMAAAGDNLYLATAFGYSDRYPLLRVDLANGQVHEAVPLSDPATGALAVAVAPDGTLFAAGSGRAGCEIDRLAPGARATTRVFTSRAACDSSVDRSDHLKYTMVAMAHASGHLYLVQRNLAAVQDIDLATGTATDLPGTSAIAHPDDIAAGSDGKLYVLDSGRIFRVDPRTGGSSLFGSAAGFSIAADGQGHLFAVMADTVVSYDLASGAATTVVGRAEVNDVLTGPLPGALIRPAALAAGPGGDLLLLDAEDSVLLRARF